MTARTPTGPPIVTATGSAEAFRALGVLCEPPDPAHAVVAAALDLDAWPAAADDTGLFTTHLLPYAAVYVGPEGMLGGVAADRVAGFWRAVGYDPPAEPDHLAALLGLYAALSDAESGERDAARRLLRRQARRALLWEHLLTWVPAYAAAVAANGSAVHADWAALLTELLMLEAAELDPPGDGPQHFADVPPLPEPEEGIDAFVRAVLTPVRSGLVISRSDLTRCARDLGLGARIGERAFVLGWLIDQDPAAVLAWIGDQAARWASRHRTHLDLLGAFAGHWELRATATVAAANHRRLALLEVLSDVP